MKIKFEEKEDWLYWEKYERMNINEPEGEDLWDW
jgi:hypothetical protein